MGVVKYVVAKYIPDLLRNEPRNIGVVVESNSDVAARFIGEDGDGHLDLRRVKGGPFHDPQLYAEWHAYWRSLLEDPGEDLFDQLIKANEASFSIWRGGEVHSETSLALQTVADDLYGRLVDKLSDDVSMPDAAAERGLAQTIRDAFRSLRILEDRRRGGSLFAQHPVRYRPTIHGTVPVPHRPTFVQENGRRFVMEQIDFGRAKQELVRQHSGYVTFMFSDIQEAAQQQNSGMDTDLIAIVNRVTGRNVEVQEYGLAALHQLPQVRIVNWDDEYQRGRFLEERVEVANVKG